MIKLSLAAVAAATLCMSDDAGQRPNPTVPWLELDAKTKLPKVHIALGRDVASIGRSSCRWWTQISASPPMSVRHSGACSHA